jgi:ABC-type uncharacterized transport system permease subunit
MRAMSNNPVFELAGIAALLPLTVAGMKGQLRVGLWSWTLLGAALVGGSLPAIEDLGRGWSAGLSLDVSVLALLAMFAVATLFVPGSVRLAGMVGPYALLLLVLGWLVSAFEPAAAGGGWTGAWFAGHVLLAIASYGALTMAALAAGAVLLLERALKARADSWAGRALPPLDVIEATQNGMLKAAAILMFLALVTGSANEYLVAGQILAFTHKILLSFLAFLVLCLVLFLHHRTGLRGRRAARWLLAGFLLLILAYPGVKFVREFLIS